MVHVVPRASKNSVVGAEGDVVKIRLTAPPVEGKANDALVKFLSSLLNVPRSSVEIIAGHSARHKTIGIRGVSAAQVAQALVKGKGDQPLGTRR